MKGRNSEARNTVNCESATLEPTEEELIQGRAAVLTTK